MPIIFGKDTNREGILARVGRIKQLAGLRPIVLDGGKAKSLPAVDFRTGEGLNFTVLIDRGLDISRAEFQGPPLSSKEEISDFEGGLHLSGIGEV